MPLFVREDLETDPETEPGSTTLELMQRWAIWFIACSMAGAAGGAGIAPTIHWSLHSATVAVGLAGAVFQGAYWSLLGPPRPVWPVATLGGWILGPALVTLFPGLPSGWLSEPWAPVVTVGSAGLLAALLQSVQLSSFKRGIAWLVLSVVGFLGAGLLATGILSGGVGPGGTGWILAGAVGGGFVGLTTGGVVASLGTPTPLRRVRATMAATGPLLVLLFAWPIALHALADRRLEAVRVTWAAAGLDPPDSLPASTPLSDSAHQLTRLCATMGLALAPVKSGLSPPPEHLVRRFDGLYNDISSYTTGDILEAAGEEVPPCPPHVREFLVEYRHRLRQISEHILESAPLQWPFERERGFESPIPNVLGHMKLQRLLIAAAAVHPDDASIHLPAARRLNLSLGRRPELICRMFAGNAAGGIAAAERKLEADPTPSLNPREQVITGLLNDTRLFHVFVANLAATRKGEFGPLGQLKALLDVPVLRFWASDQSFRLFELREHLLTEPPCFLDPTFDDALMSRVPSWNPLGRLMTPRVSALWNRALGSALEIELTQLVHQARAEHLASGRWPQGDIPSEVCPSLVWHRDAWPDDTFNQRLSAPLPWSGRILEFRTCDAPP